MSYKIWHTIKEVMKLTGYSDTRIREFIKEGKIARGNWRKTGPRNAYQIRIPEAQNDISNNVQLRHAMPGSPGKTSAPVHIVVPTSPEVRKSADGAVTDCGFGALTLSQAQEENARQKAAKIKMENDKLAGRLVEKKDVESQAFNCARLARDAILNVPERIGAELASITDPHLVAARMTEELTQALEGIAEEVRA